MNNFAAIVMTDGRKTCIKRSIESISQRVTAKTGVREKIIIDDSGDPQYRRWLKSNFDDWVVRSHPERLGFCGSYADAWFIASNIECNYVFQCEDDFVIMQDIDLDYMAGILKAHPELFQLALMRQPWNSAEKAAGGIVQLDPENFHQEEGFFWHRKFFTTNNSLIPVQSYWNNKWIEEPECEGRLTHAILAQTPQKRFGYLGETTDPPRIWHIGEERVGSGY